MEKDLIKSEGSTEEKEYSYKISLEGDVLKVAFGVPAQNDKIVQDTNELLDKMIESGQLKGGPVIKINGPASLPVAVALSHKLTHLFETVAVFDPKLGKYVVSVSHGTENRPGDLID